MRYVSPVVATVLVAVLVSGCSGRQGVPSNSTHPKTTSQTPTVTLTEPAGGPTRTR
ncbi:hypothetical protein MINT15_15000 [Saccharomonospora viridis]|uniref:Uncharacterized protein n=1 Tax=Saccharomonospora viridis TaxID=1852 RepID=A0A837DCH1_9PSEU|nr:hypothetical protein MINT15_15000 [Saccharomonospora viridis]